MFRIKSFHVQLKKIYCMSIPTQNHCPALVVKGGGVKGRVFRVEERAFWVG